MWTCLKRERKRRPQERLGPRATLPLVAGPAAAEEVPAGQEEEEEEDDDDDMEDCTGVL